METSFKFWLQSLKDLDLYLRSSTCQLWHFGEIILFNHHRVLGVGVAETNKIYTVELMKGLNERAEYVAK